MIMLRLVPYLPAILTVASLAVAVIAPSSVSCMNRCQL